MAKAKNQLHSTTPSVSDSTVLSTNNYNSNSDSPAPSVPVNTVDKTDNNSSHNISISSINENDDNDSSNFESSDSECEDAQIRKAIECIPHSLQPGGQLTQNGMLVLKDENDAPASTRGPNIGSIAVQNSSDITFGNKTYIKGQVVIKNIYRDRQNGVVNEGYQQTDEELNCSKQATGSETSQSPWWQRNIKAVIKDKPLMSVMILVSLMVIITAIVIVIMLSTSAGKTRLKPLYGDGDDDRAYVPPDTGIDEDFFPDPKPLRLVTRNEWLAAPPRDELAMLKLPVNRVIIAHTATEGCTTQSECVILTSRIQQFHQASDSKNFSDIAYNFLVGGDGNAYEGRGWEFVGAHTKGFNTDSICIAFIGTFSTIEPKKAQLSAAQQLLALGLEQNKLAKHYRLYGHRQLAPFDSPGRALYKILQKWPHWSNEFADTQEPEPEEPNSTRR